MSQLTTSKEYTAFLNDLKERVSTCRYKTAIRLNKELMALYHSIGTSILHSQEQYGWGSKVIEQLSKDLRYLAPKT